MRKIKLSQQGQINKGKFVALIDDEDYEYLNQFKWCVFNNRYTFYAGRWIHEKGRRKLILLHREIMNTAIGLQVDHRDHNGLNCQRSNLRNCTRAENLRNVKARGNHKYKGVYRCRKYFLAQISINGKIKHLGNFKIEEDAAKKFDEMAKIYHGEFANLNFK